MMRRATGLLPAALLLGACGSAEGPGPQAATGLEAGARVYANYCVACHQRDGRGAGPGQPSLAGSAVVAGDPRPLIRWLLHGERPDALPARRSVVVMPRYDWLSDGDLAAVVSYVRGSFGNGQPPVDAAAVAAERGG